MWMFQPNVISITQIAKRMQQLSNQRSPVPDLPFGMYSLH